ncbi:hypothetical protein QBC34DRAFT_363836 [Podospora aff. communis PSN243]|uniref:Ubiquitin 3 binding protein But2 C-terminal domain-containing protein n=1 Tax=Podospora aff. communis PSN243 TaxID=3040156 RepID=A0AAV9FZA7_9PEZI|nr:hypothetical protein QBC34DRAFT_363836 [Podospora aff. communis PSN243]
MTCLRRLSIPLLTLLLPAIKAQTSLQLWEITRLTTSGMPYRSESACHDPLNTIAVEIHDPNTYPILTPGSLNLTTSETQTTQCIAKFPYCSPLYNQPFNCTDASHGRWSFTFFPTDERTDTAFWNPGQNFTLSIRFVFSGSESESESESGSGVEKGVLYTGQASFSVWENLRGLCSAGGVCSFSLREEAVPVLVRQREVV